LGIERIPSHGIVFDLRADSTDIAPVRNLLLSMLSIDVPIVLWFESPTIAQQANELSKLVVPTQQTVRRKTRCLEVTPRAWFPPHLRDARTRLILTSIVSQPLAPPNRWV